MGTSRSKGAPLQGLPSLEAKSDGKPPAGRPTPNTMLPLSPFLLTLQVINKKGILARITSLVSERGIGIEALNFNSSNKGNVSILSLRLRARKGQLQGLMNDARKVSEVKDMVLSAV